MKTKVLKTEKPVYYYDQQEDSLWVVLKEGEEDRYEELAPGINAEYDRKGNLISIEFLDFSKQKTVIRSLTGEKEAEATFGKTFLSNST